MKGVTWNMSRSDSAKPIVYMETAMLLARVNMRPELRQFNTKCENKAAKKHIKI